MMWRMRYTLNVRLSQEERGALSELAARERRTLGATVRWLILEAAGLPAPKDAAERRIERLRGVLAGGAYQPSVRERIVEPLDE